MLGPRREAQRDGVVESKKKGHGTDVNDHYASIVHEERMAKFRREADASRRAADVSRRAGRPGAGFGLRSRWIPVGAAAIIAALIALAMASPASAYDPTFGASAGLDVIVQSPQGVAS
jgi:hypothetical protein